jgi:hypothetical protein
VQHAGLLAGFSLTITLPRVRRKKEKEQIFLPPGSGDLAFYLFPLRSRRDSLPPFHEGNAYFFILKYMLLLFFNQSSPFILLKKLNIIQFLHNIV